MPYRSSSAAGDVGVARTGSRITGRCSRAPRAARRAVLVPSEGSGAYPRFVRAKGQLSAKAMQWRIAGQANASGDRMLRRRTCREAGSGLVLAGLRRA
jgi:hypothetical protein